MLVLPSDASSSLSALSPPRSSLGQWGADSTRERAIQSMAAWGNPAVTLLYQHPRASTNPMPTTRYTVVMRPTQSAEHPKKAGS